MSAISSVPGRPGRLPAGRDDGGGDRGLPQPSTPAATRACSTRSSSGSSSAPTCSSATRRARATTRARSSRAIRSSACSARSTSTRSWRSRRAIAYEIRLAQTNGAHAHRHPRHAVGRLHPLRPPRHVCRRRLQRVPARLRRSAAGARASRRAGRSTRSAFDSGMDYSAREASARGHGPRAGRGTCGRSASCRATCASSRSTGPGC